MMLRVGLVYTLAIIVGLVVAMAWLFVATLIFGNDPKHWTHRFGLVTLSRFCALLLLILVPMALSTGFGNWVWVIDDGNQYRRYVLYGPQGRVETLDGKFVEFAIGPGKVVETVVNGTSTPVLIEMVQYGGVMTYGSGFRETVEPGKSISLNQPLNVVMDPPATMSSKSGVTSMLFAHQVK